MKVLVTGANGFVGRRLCRELADDGHHVRALVRTVNSEDIPGVEFAHGDVTDEATARSATHDIDAVVHLAARAHVMHDRVANPLQEYRRVNVDGTRTILHAAGESRVSRFVLASSVKAVGETSNGVWDSRTVARPVDPYGVSKLEAEEALRADQSSLAKFSLRFPLVYGPGMRGNMLRLFDLIDHGWPVPVGNTANARSLLFVGNATAAIRRVLDASLRETRPSATGTFFLADGPPVSTAALVGEIGEALGAYGRTFRIPLATFQRLFAFRGLSRFGGVLNRLGGSLVVNEREFESTFAFVPPFTRESGLAETARWFQSR